MFETKHRNVRAANRKQRWKLQLESLDRRELMAANLSLDAGVLTIDADHRGGTVEARQWWGRVVISSKDVTGRTKWSNFSSRDVDKLIFRGSSKADKFTNHTAIRDEIWGGPGNDTLVAGHGPSFIAGGRGNDRIDGRGGHDRIRGELGNDLMQGGKGNDRYLFDTDVQLGNDTIREGSLFVNQGIDTIDFSRSDAGVSIDLSKYGRQRINRNLTLDLGFAYRVENVVGSQGNDRIFGSSADNRFEGRGGNDRLDGKAGNDTYVFDTDTQQGSDWVVDQQGNDTLDFSKTRTQPIMVDLATSRQTVNRNLAFNYLTGIDNAVGGDKDDKLSGNQLANRLDGRRGNDVLIGRSGIDSLSGGHGNDRLLGGEGFDFLYGQFGNDDLYGEGGVDWLFGGAGLDGLYGGTGDDLLVGGTGADRILQRAYLADRIIGHEDHDAVLVFADGYSTTKGNVNWRAGRFSEEEIMAVDTALSVMHRHTESTDLLKSSSGQPVTFFRHRPERVSRITGWNDGSSIHLAHAAFPSGDEDWTSQVIFSEFGHFWDQPGENSMIGYFRDISGWTKGSNTELPPSSDPRYRQTHDGWWFIDDGRFATESGKWGPRNDFAGSFAAYFMDIAGRPYEGSGSSAIPEKIAYVDAFVKLVA